MNKLKFSLVFLLIVCILLTPIIAPTQVFAKSRIDIVFIIDRSGSMGNDIRDVRNEIKNFTDKLSRQGLAYRLGLISYEYSPRTYSLTSSVDVFKQNLSNINVSGGTENGLDAIMEALNTYTFYDNAIKYFVLIGDETVTSRKGYSNQEVINELKRNDVILTAVGDSSVRSQFRNLSSSTGGLYLSLGSNFSTNLEKIFDQIQAIPILDVTNPRNGQMVSDLGGLFIPTVKVSDPDSDTLTLKYYIDNSSQPRDTKIITNTQTQHVVTFDALNLSSIGEGKHTLKFTADDGSDVVQEIINITVDIVSPNIDSFNVVPQAGSIIVSGSATDTASGLHGTPYRYTVGDKISSWISSSTYNCTGLTPNSLYNVKLEVRDRVGHISDKHQNIYTKVQKPNIILNNATEESITFSIQDNNPLSTEYQIKIGNQYLDQSGSLTATANWIILSEKMLEINGLSSNTKYGIIATAKNHDGLQEISNTFNAMTLAQPPFIEVNNERKSIELSWNPVPYALGYDIEVDGAVVENGTFTNYTHSGLDRDTFHTYRIRVRNSGGTGRWSRIYEEYTLPFPPTTPQNIKTVLSQEEIEISWDSSLRVENYELEVDGSIVNNGCETTYIHEDLEPDSEHKYRVRAVNRGGESEWSELLTVASLPYPPETPTNIIVNKTKNSITLNWDEMERAEAYELEVDGFIIDNGKETVYVHENLEPLSGHRYRIRAKNRGGKSAWTSQLDITTHPEKPDIPVNIMATSDETSISVTWYKPPHTESYDLEIDGRVVTDIKETLYKHSGLTPDTKHVYRVRAKNVSGMSDWSSPVTMFTLPKIEEGEENFALANVIAVVTNEDITLSWDAVAANASYKIEVDGEIKDNGEETVFIHSGLEANTFHSYKIKVVKEDGKENWCGVLTLSTLPNIPDAPHSLTGIPTHNSIELRWERIDGGSGYDLELDGETISINDINQLNYIHDNLEPGTSHTYRLRAKNITGVTAWSSALVLNTTNPMYTINANEGMEFDLSLLANNVQDFTELKFVVTYNPEELEIIDLNKYAANKNITSGKIEGTNMNVQLSSGKIEITVDESLVPGTSWSGEITDILFKAKVSGNININFIVE
ncbi:fibronectin type III domain-containing protein [Abyssisolibacter fermentans]|uniref:fibronectin type III domain-containing protein n=1 Tax=Abyssisolibacter fermentans TaxID=1766203 RepID=UPI00082D557E|nr:VWA domain-containing protein [Abyssisolibacter fermentans]